MPSEHDTTAPRDVRMRGFAARSTVQEAWAWLDAQLATLPPEEVPLGSAAGRVLAADVTAPCDVPAFDRAMMDGFALRAEETHGASTMNPLRLEVIGQAFPGSPFAGEVERGQAVQIMTGAPMPAGADAVLPAERCEIPSSESSPRTVAALGEVPPGRHIGRRGEDIQTGAVVLTAGRRLRPQDVGVLASLGIAKVAVIRQPRVRIVVTGNELIVPGEPSRPYHIYDANSSMLENLARRDGAGMVEVVRVRDDQQRLLSELTASECDVLLVSGGSSVGAEDHAPRLIAEHGQLAIHGIAMRPSSPAGLGKLGDRLVFLLPGNPVSCLCAYDFFAGRAIRAIGGLSKDWPYACVRRQLTRKIVSVIGRLDYCRVQAVGEDKIEPLAIGGASVLSSTTRACGFAIVPEDSEGYPPGTEIDVYLYDKQG